MKCLATFLALSSLLSAVLADAPIVNEAQKDGVVTDQYIVVYKDNADLKDRNKHEEEVSTKAKKKNKKGIQQSFNITGFSGYNVEIAPDDLSLITKDSRVSYLEKVVSVGLNLPSLPEPASIDTSKFNDAKLSRRALTASYGYNWGTRRISHRSKSAFLKSTSYVYDTTAGAGTYIYILDTGVNINHQEFNNGRATWGANFVPGSPNTDQNGHGTHVAGIAAGKYVGVAKNAKIIAVKVLNAAGIGSNSQTISGLQWAAVNAIIHGRAGKSVINLSLRGGYSQAVNQMVAAVTNAGVTVVVAAGNDAKSAALWSPASAPSAITVAASDSTDKWAWFSNYGSLVDIIAPGVSILSSYNNCPTCYQYISGTSQASPHIAGLVSYFMAKDGIKGPVASTQKIISWSSKGFVTGVPAGTPNRLAYNGDGL